MKVARLTDIGKKGFNVDLPSWDLPLAYLSEGANVRIRHGRVESFGGDAEWSDPGVHFNAGFLIPVLGGSSNFWIIAGRSAVYAFDGTTWSDISSASGYAAIGTDQELLWNGCMMGRIPVINNPRVYPEYWSPQSGGQVLQQLDFDSSNTFKDKGYSMKVLRNHKNYLFALNLTEGAVDYPNTFRWSHPADINGLPASWDETDNAFLAGRRSIGANTGDIVDGLSLRDSFVIYSEKGVHVLYPRNDEFVWTTTELSSSVGLMSKDCLVQVEGNHVFLADGDIFLNDGQRLKSVIHNKFRSAIRDVIDEANYDRAFAFRNDHDKEVWFCVPSVDATYPDAALIWNWRDDVWSYRGLDNTPFIASGPISTGITSWNSWSGNWDEGSGTWNSGEPKSLTDTVIGLDKDNSSLRYQDPVDGPENAYTSRVTRLGLDLGEGQDVVSTITRAYLHIEGAGEVDVQFGYQRHAGGPVTWGDVITMTPSEDRKVDLRVTGSLFCYSITSTDGKLWMLSGMDIEYENDGRR